MSRAEILVKAFPKYPELSRLMDKNWRINNLYFIKDPDGNKIKFQLNWAQKDLLACTHPNIIVLKCRQIGITTYFSLLLLDAVLWQDNVQAGIIAQTLEDSSNIFKDKLKYAFDNLDPRIRPLFQCVGDSAKELAFKHGSVIRVGTSLRGHTLQYLHVSEFGKVCARDPEKAREIVTGAFNTIHIGQRIFVESTAEGKEGYFFEMCQRAFDLEKEKANLSPMDFKPFFFPWHKEPAYTL
jgi:hypothetical protein